MLILKGKLFFDLLKYVFYSYFRHFIDSIYNRPVLSPLSTAQDVQTCHLFMLLLLHYLKILPDQRTQKLVYTQPRSLVCLHVQTGKGEREAVMPYLYGCLYEALKRQ